MDLLILVVCAVIIALLSLNRRELLKVIQERDSKLEQLLTDFAKREEQEVQLRSVIEFANLEYSRIENELLKEQSKNQTIISQKKSSETRLGQISEHLIPFLEGCPYNPKNLHFLGMPIDYISFDFDDGNITFIEVKSGNSKPSKRQKTIKNIIEAGRIYYDEIRIDQKGVKAKSTKDKK